MLCDEAKYEMTESRNMHARRLTTYERLTIADSMCEPKITQHIVIGNLEFDALQELPTTESEGKMHMMKVATSNIFRKQTYYTGRTDSKGSKANSGKAARDEGITLVIMQSSLSLMLDPSCCIADLSCLIKSHLPESTSALQ